MSANVTPTGQKRGNGTNVKIESTLNHRAHRICDFLSQIQDELRITRQDLSCGSTIYDYGTKAIGGLRAGIHLAEICLAGLAEVKLVPGLYGQAVSVYTDHPLAACLASQYAGWQVSADNYFAMGSGPMRASRAKEAIIQELEFEEKSESVVGVLETAQLPTDEVCRLIASECGISPTALILCVARTSSMAGNIQVVARSLETALHKIHELGFDLKQIRSGFGKAPLPPVTANDLEGIGRTNDAVLYGGEVTIWAEAQDSELEEIVKRTPSSSSSDYGVPFKQIFDRYNGDFYKIDPLLFSPAQVTINNLTSGNSFTAGELRQDILAESFGVSMS